MSAAISEFARLQQVGLPLLRAVYQALLARVPDTDALNPGVRREARVSASRKLLLASLAPDQTEPVPSRVLTPAPSLVVTLALAHEDGEARGGPRYTLAVYPAQRYAEVLYFDYMALGDAFMSYQRDARGGLVASHASDRVAINTSFLDWARSLEEQGCEPLTASRSAASSPVAAAP